jgi:hypothetical protein
LHERRRTAGRYADRDVAARKAGNARRTGVRIVFRSLDGSAQRAVAARDQARVTLGRKAERRLQFRRIEYG